MNPIGTMNPMNMLSTSQFPQQQTTTTTTTIPMPANTAIYPPPPPPQQQQQQQPPPPPPPLPVQVQVTGQTQQPPPPPQLATTATTIFQPPPYVNQRCSRGTIIAGHEKNKEESDEDNDGIELKIERDEDLDNDTALKKAELNKKISDLEALCEQKTKEKEEKTKAAKIVYKRASEAITECKVVQQEYTDFIRKCEMEKCYYAASLNALALMGYNVSELRATEKASLNGQKRRASDRDVKVAECGLRPLAKKPAIEGGGSVVKINVGGQVFTLSRENLSKFKGTLLYEQFSGDYDALTDSSGILFIDRNGDVFKHVAEYIRSGTCECTRSINKASEYDLAQLCAEAEFFGLDQLVYEIRGADLPTSMKVPFKCRKLLTEWCQAASFTLLYQASKHKFSSTDFHRLCNGKSPTLVIVRSGDCIFGGYTEVPWKTTQDPELAEGSGAEFLFSLVNKSGSDPIKFPLKNKSQKKCILQCGRYGPSFGADVKGMCELHIANNANINSHSHTMGFPSMFSGRDCDKTIFAGSERFQVMEYEVFLVKRRGNGT